MMFQTPDRPGDEQEQVHQGDDDGCDDQGDD